jgi:hypothetical protein
LPNEQPLPDQQPMVETTTVVESTTLRQVAESDDRGIAQALLKGISTYGEIGIQTAVSTLVATV